MAHRGASELVSKFRENHYNVAETIGKVTVYIRQPSWRDERLVAVELNWPAIGSVDIEQAKAFSYELQLSISITDQCRDLLRAAGYRIKGDM